MTKYVVTTDLLMIKGRGFGRGTELDLPNDNMPSDEVNGLVERGAITTKADTTDEDVAPPTGGAPPFPTQPETDPNRVVAPIPEPVRAPAPDETVDETVVETPGQRHRRRNGV